VITGFGKDLSGRPQQPGASIVAGRLFRVCRFALRFETFRQR
jgi:hypothetical protein